MDPTEYLVILFLSGLGCPSRLYSVNIIVVGKITVQAQV